MRLLYLVSGFAKKMKANGRKIVLIAVLLTISGGVGISMWTTNVGDPLPWALANGHVGIADLLTVLGNDLEADQKDGFLGLAARNGDDRAAALLLDLGADPEAVDLDTQPPLHVAALHGHGNVAALLLAAGANPNGRDLGFGWRPLHYAAKNGHGEVAALLLDRGADLEGRGRAGWRPLQVAAEHGHGEFAALLLDRGADPNGRNDLGRAPLHTAAAHGHGEFAALLLDRGADLEARSYAGWRPLHVAAAFGYGEFVALLLDMGADPKERDDGGPTPERTPVQVAVDNGHGEVAALLLDKGAHFKADVNQLLFQAALKGHVEAVRLLLDRRLAEPNLEGDFGDTLLHKVVRNNSSDYHVVASLLLAAGADPNVRDINGFLITLETKQHLV